MNSEFEALAVELQEYQQHPTMLPGTSVQERHRSEEPKKEPQISSDQTRSQQRAPMQDPQAPGWDQMKLESHAFIQERGHLHIHDANLKHLQNPKTKMSACSENFLRREMLLLLPTARSLPTPQHLEEPDLEASRPLPRQTETNLIGPPMTWVEHCAYFNHGMNAQ